MNQSRSDQEILQEANKRLERMIDEHARSEREFVVENDGTLVSRRKNDKD